MQQCDLSDIGVEFFREDHRDRSVDALAHLDLRHHQRDLAGFVDADEGVGREPAVGHVGRLHRLVDRGAKRQMEGQHEAGRETAGQQRAA